MIEKRKGLSSKDMFSYLAMVYAVVSVSMNIFCMKSLSFGTNIIVCDGGQTISWIVFLVSNVIVEVWGERESMKVVTGAAVIAFAMLVLGRLIVFVPTTEAYAEQAGAFAQIFSNGPRTIIASVTAFWVGNLVNVHIIARLKALIEKKGSDNRLLFFFRAAFSTLVGQLVDNALFMVLAFAPVGLSVYEMAWFDIMTAVLSGTVIELVIEAFFVPFITIPLVRSIKRKVAAEAQA